MVKKKESRWSKSVVKLIGESVVKLTGTSEVKITGRSVVNPCIMIDVGLVARYKCPRIIFHKSKCQIIVTRYSPLSYHQFYDRSLWVTMTAVSFYPAAFPSSPAVSRTRSNQHDVLARSHACTLARMHAHTFGRGDAFYLVDYRRNRNCAVSAVKEVGWTQSGTGPSGTRRHRLAPTLSHAASPAVNAGVQLTHAATSPGTARHPPERLT